MLAPNETGAIMPLAEAAAAARPTGRPCTSQAAKAFEKIPVSVKRFGVNLLSVTARKCYGPMRTALGW